MEAQLERPSHGHEGGAHSDSVDQEGEQKRSVLKKVKDKAKKIKDTIKKHGHVGDQRHHHQSNVDGGPMYESSVVRNTDLPRGNNSLENPRTESPAPAEDPHSPNTRPTNIPRTDHHQPLNPEDKDSSDTKDSSDKPLTESASEYAHKFAETVGPVYEKVAGAVSEKLKPGAEDKALSEVITDTLLLHKKSGDDKEEAHPPPRAKVTVSKEVAERLGTDRESKREGEDAVAAGEQSTGETMGERLQNAVTTWLAAAGSTGIQTAQDSVYNAFVNDDASSGTAGGGGGPTREEPRHR